MILPLFDRPYITYYWWSIATTSLSCTVAEILQLYIVHDCVWLQFVVWCASISASVSIRQLKLSATCTLWFMCKHTVVDMCYISRGMGVRKTSDSKVTFRLNQCHWCWCHSIGHMWFTDSLLVFHCNYVSVLYYFWDIINHFPTFKELRLTWPWTHALWGYSVMHAILLVSVNLHKI